MTPERLFERQWALALLDSVMATLRAEYAKAGKESFFESVKESLAGADIPLAAIAEQFGMTANAAKVAAHRLRKRYRELLRLAVAQTLADPGELADEIRQLFAAIPAQCTSSIKIRVTFSAFCFSKGKCRSPGDRP